MKYQKYQDYYTYDEQHPKLDGKQKIKGCITDVLQNKIIAIKFYDNIRKENIKTFLDECMPPNKRFSISTNHLLAYFEPIEKLGFKYHQKCIIHLFKIINRKIKDNISKFKDEDKIEKIKKTANKIKSIFSTDNIDTA